MDAVATFVEAATVCISATQAEGKVDPSAIGKQGWATLRFTKPTIGELVFVKGPEEQPVILMLKVAKKVSCTVRSQVPENATPETASKIFEETVSGLEVALGRKAKLTSDGAEYLRNGADPRESEVNLISDGKDLMLVVGSLPY